MSKRVSLHVEGMTCTGCEQHVTQALESAGAVEVSADWRAGQARFTLPDGVGEPALRDAVAAAGYPSGDLEATGQAPAGRRPHRADEADYDLLVLGAGSAAFAAAIAARDAGRTVAVVESGTVGGTCVNVGCVPSKALLRAGELRAAARDHRFAGLDVTVGGEVDLAALVTQKDELVASLRQHKYLDLVDAYGFEIIVGRGRFADPDTVVVGDRRLHARDVLVATGASPAAPPIPGLADAGYRTHVDIMDLTRLPGRLAVIGAGAVGLELGQFFAQMGSQVTFLDVAERIAPVEEPEVSRVLARVLADGGATVHTAAEITKVVRDGDLRRLTAVVDGQQRIVEADEILVATGRRPNTADLGLDAAGVEVDRAGGIVVDEYLRTANPVVWAAGDVIAQSPQFVYVSAYHGNLAAQNALNGAAQPVDYTGLPRVTFTAPQIAAAGQTEAEARTASIEVATSVLDLAHVPRALVNRDTRGVVKLVAEAASGRLVGASMLADGAGEAIQAATLAIRHGMTVAELAATFHPYLTMAEGLKLAAQTFDRDVTRLSCCAA